MADKAETEIDFEQMDDLPFFEHFEWHLLQIDEVATKKSGEEYHLEWKTA